jgi:hypothetical protein
MTPREAVKLTRYVKACCPQQAFDEYTSDAWHDLLGDLDADECTRAVAEVAKRQPFVAPAEIRAEVRRIRNERLRNSDLAIPPGDPADEESYRRSLANIRRHIGDGRVLFKAIESGGGTEPSENEAVAEVRDELAERRLREIRDRNPRPDPTGPTCVCGAALDPDGFCFTCETRTGASS